MDHTPESAYAICATPAPPCSPVRPGDGAIGIMRWPMTEGQVLHRDEEQVVLEGPVVLPDGRQERLVRILAARPEPPVAVLPVLDGQVVDRFRHAARTWAWEILRGARVGDVGDAQNAAGSLRTCSVRCLGSDRPGPGSPGPGDAG